MVDFASKLKRNQPMPKEVLRSGAPPAAAPAAAKPVAPATVANAATDPNKAKLDEMEARLKGMNLDPEIIASAMAKERKKLAGADQPAAAAAPAKVVTPVAAPKTVEPVKPVVPTPVTSTAPAERVVSDEEFAAAAAASYEQGDDLPPEDQPLVPATTEGAAPESAHSDEDDGVPTGTVVVRGQYFDASEGAISGPIDRTDFKTPQLKIVQGSGPLSEKFNQGTLIYMDQTIFAPPEPDKPGPPIHFVPVAIQKYFRESIQRDPNAPKGTEQRQPRNAATLDEVRQLGGTTEFSVVGDKRIKPTWAPAARCLVIVERPEGVDHPGFGLELEIGGKMRAFAPAVMYVNGGQYRAFVKPIMDATSFLLCEGSGKDRKIVLEKRLWKLQVVKEKSGDNMVFNPKIAMIDEATPPDIKDYAKSLRG